MHRLAIPHHDKIFYTTGRLTSEMVIKTVRMGIPILISRSGFTAWGVDLARTAGLTLIGRTRGHRFLALSETALHYQRVLEASETLSLPIRHAALLLSGDADVTEFS